MATHENMNGKNNHKELPRIKIDKSTVIRVLGLLDALGLSVLAAHFMTMPQADIQHNTPPNTWPDVPAVVEDCDAVLDLNTSMYFDVHGQLLDQDQIPQGAFSNKNTVVGPLTFRNGKTITDAACVEEQN